VGTIFGSQASRYRTHPIRLIRLLTATRYEFKRFSWRKSGSSKLKSTGERATTFDSAPSIAVFRGFKAKSYLDTQSHNSGLIILGTQTRQYVSQDRYHRIAREKPGAARPLFHSLPRPTSSTPFGLHPTKQPRGRPIWISLLIHTIGTHNSPLEETVECLSAVKYSSNTPLPHLNSTILIRTRSSVQAYHLLTTTRASTAAEGHPRVISRTQTTCHLRGTEVATTRLIHRYLFITWVSTEDISSVRPRPHRVQPITLRQV